jgi:hypothetical protein
MREGMKKTDAYEELVEKHGEEKVKENRQLVDDALALAAVEQLEIVQNVFKDDLEEIEDTISKYKEITEE